MPNHVMNCVEILDNIDTVNKIVSEVGSSEGAFDCNKIIPMPDEIKETEGAWYDWCIANWGSKWGAYDQTKPEDVEILLPKNNSLRFIKEENPNSMAIMRISFSTAWSPISPVMAALSEKYPSAVIKYSFSEEGNGFAGFEYFKGGQLVKEIDKSHRIPSVTKYVTGYSFRGSHRGFEEIFKDIQKILKCLKRT
jgi:hypothetical protein